MDRGPSEPWRRESAQPHRLGGTPPRTVAVLRALHLGDTLCAVPALRALRHALPDARITLIGLPWAALIPQRFPQYIDSFLPLPGFPGFPEQEVDPVQTVRLLARAQAERFDLAIQMHGDGRHSNLLVGLLGARRTAGFYRPGGFCPDPDLFTPYVDDVPELLRCLQLMEFLGAPPRGDHLEFPLFSADFRELERILQFESLVAGRYVCIHPGSREPARRWTPAGFAAAGDALASRGLAVVLTGLPEEAVLTRQVAAVMRAPSVDLAGRTTLGGLAALLSRAALVVCNDTGVSHLAAALGVPSVVVFVRSPPARWAPLDGARHRAVGRNGAPPAPTEVIREAEGLLGQVRRHGVVEEAAR